MNAQNQSQDEMLVEAKACLRRRDYASAHALAQTLVARDPNDSEAIRILLTADTKLHNQARAEPDEGFISRRSASDIKSAIGGLVFFVAGISLLFSGVQAGWNGTVAGRTRSGAPTETRGSTVILMGLTAGVGGGVLMFIGFRRFRLR